jgi:chorismate mutase/prephenate dehydratase
MIRDVACFGPPGSFTHQAAVKSFGPDAHYLAAPVIDEVFSLVEEEKAVSGVVPVENSNEGAVTSTLDLLVDSPLLIAGELFLPIRLLLLSREESLAAVRTVYSHPQALGQSREWLRRHLPQARLAEEKSTSEAAAHAALEKGAAAVAGELAGRLYGLRALAEGVEDRGENVTRFLILSREPAPATGDDKTSVVLSVPHKPGALHAMLRPLAEGGVNMSRIESRPSKKKAWDYLFFIDFAGHRDEPAAARALGELRNEALFLKVLGSYPAASPRG